MGNRILIFLLIVFAMGLFCCKSRPADIITAAPPGDSPTHQVSLKYLMYDSSVKDDTNGLVTDISINRITSVLLDSVRNYVVSGMDTYRLKTGMINIYAASRTASYEYSEMTIKPDSILIYGKFHLTAFVSKTDTVRGYKVN